MSIQRTTRKVAEMAGFIINDKVYPWIAYRGDDLYECWTDEEVRLMDELEKARQQLQTLIPQSHRNVIALRPRLVVDNAEAGAGYVNQD